MTPECPGEGANSGHGTGTRCGTTPPEEGEKRKSQCPYK
jgi:hypothetical protein